MVDYYSVRETLVTCPQELRLLLLGTAITVLHLDISFVLPGSSPLFQRIPAYLYEAHRPTHLRVSSTKRARIKPGPPFDAELARLWTSARFDREMKTTL